eukprot:g10529.t2
MLRGLRRRFIEHGLEGWAVRSSAVNEMDSFLRKMSLVLEEAGRGRYTLVVTKAGFGQRGRLAMVALSGLVAFHNAVGHCRAVLCASGTLAPFPLFKRELGLELEGRVGLAGAEMKDFFDLSSSHSLILHQNRHQEEIGQSPHVSRRLKVLAIKAVEGQKLSSTRSFRAQHGAQYLSSLAKVLQLLLPAPWDDHRKRFRVWDGFGWDLRDGVMVDG